MFLYIIIVVLILIIVYSYCTLYDHRKDLIGTWIATKEYCIQSEVDSFIMKIERQDRTSSDLGGRWPDSASDPEQGLRPSDPVSLYSQQNGRLVGHIVIAKGTSILTNQKIYIDISTSYFKQLQPTFAVNAFIKFDDIELFPGKVTMSITNSTAMSIESRDHKTQYGDLRKM